MLYSSDIFGLLMLDCRCKFVSPSGTELSIPAAMVNCERCELVISEVQNHTTLERVDVSDNHFDDCSGEMIGLCMMLLCNILSVRRE